MFELLMMSLFSQPAWGTFDLSLYNFTLVFLDTLVSLESTPPSRTLESQANNKRLLDTAFHILAAGGVEAVPETWPSSVGHGDTADETL